MLWEQNNILREQDNMLWEQDIILREQNNVFSRMALISHRIIPLVSSNSSQINEEKQEKQTNKKQKTKITEINFQLKMIKEKKPNTNYVIISNNICNKIV